MSLLAMQGCSWRFMSGKLHIFTTNIKLSVVIGLIIRALYIKNSKFFQHISAPIEGIFLKIHIGHCAHVRKKRCLFGYDQLIKEPLHEYFSLVSLLALEGSSWKFNLEHRTNVVKSTIVFVPRLVISLFPCSEWKVPTFFLRRYLAPGVLPDLTPLGSTQVF